MKKIIIFFILLFGTINVINASPPSSSFTYAVGEKIQPSEVQQNETNIYSYLQSGVDTYADSTIVSADITDGTIVSADITDGTIVSADIADSTIVNADISGSAAIADTKLDTISTAGKVSGNAITTGSATLTALTTAGLTASANLDIGTYELRANTLQSDVATGTAPMTIASTTKVTNLNADLLDGYNTATSFSAATQIYVSDANGYLPNAMLTAIPKNIQVFTSTGTWTKPAGVSTVYVKVWGGGGGGFSTSYTMGGGAGGYSEGLVAVSGNVTVTVGTGGAEDGDGVASSFAGDSTLTANGGVGGDLGGAGGTASGGTINLTGGAAGAGTSPVGGMGGSSPMGGSGGQGGVSAAGKAGTIPGGGGGTGTSGGVGAAGLVIVYY